MQQADRFKNGSSPPEMDEDAPNSRFDGRGPAAFGKLQEQFEELAEYVRFYVAARIDAAGASLRRAMVLAVVGLLAGLVLSAFLITCTVIGLLGLSEIVGRALGDRFWAGHLIIGFGLLLVFALTLLVAVKVLNSGSRKKTARKYAKQLEQQKARFGHDVREVRSELKRD